MDKEKVKIVLDYAKKKVFHPDRPYAHIPYTDGLPQPKTSAQLRAALEIKVKEVEDYENFVKYSDEILKEIGKYDTN